MASGDLANRLCKQELNNALLGPLCTRVSLRKLVLLLLSRLLLCKIAVVLGGCRKGLLVRDT
jgi:hypothetical protein